MSLKSFIQQSEQTAEIARVLDQQFVEALAEPDPGPLRSLPLPFADPGVYDRVWASWPQFPSDWQAAEIGKRYAFMENGQKASDVVRECAFCQTRGWERTGTIDAKGAAHELHVVCHSAPDIQTSYVCYPGCYDQFVARLKTESRRGPIEIQVPAEYLDASLDNLTRDQRALKRLSEWPWKVPFVRILAPTGRGKTYACWAAALAAARKGCRVQVETALDLRTRWIQPLSREKFEQAIMRTRWLILDEFGSAFFGFGWAEFLLKLVSYRLDNKLPTILAGKDTPKSILENMVLAGSTAGESFVSRLQSFEPCNPTGPDRREKK